jgi:hypothetical protein
VKIGLRDNVQFRVLRLEQACKLETKRLREHMIDELTVIFQMASAIAKGEARTHIIDGKRIRYSVRQRERWARVAGYIAQIIDAIAKNFDEHELDLMLTEAERLVHEARQVAENKGVELGTSATEAGTGTNAASQGSG